MRGAPHVGLAWCIDVMSSTTAPGTAGRPDARLWLFQPQYQRKPRRCHAMTVSGFTRSNASRQRGQSRDNTTQEIRSAGRSWTRRRPCCRWSTRTWWRSARSSASRSVRRRTMSRIPLRRAIRAVTIDRLWRSDTPKGNGLPLSHVWSFRKGQAIIAMFPVFILM